MMFAMVVAIGRGDPSWSIALAIWSITLAIAIPGTAIQLGCLAGISVRAALG